MSSDFPDDQPRAECLLSADAVLEAYRIHCDSSVCLTLQVSAEGYFCLYQGTGEQPIFVALDAYAALSRAYALIDGREA
jgi:hypothetical protein